MAERLLEQRWLLVSQTQAPVPAAFLMIVVFWLTVAFLRYGMFARTACFAQARGGAELAPVS